MLCTTEAKGPQGGFCMSSCLFALLLGLLRTLQKSWLCCLYVLHPPPKLEVLLPCRL